MKVFTITGWSESGKTTLITRLIKHFKLKNKQVIALKSAMHKVYLEPESTDTFRFLEAGADIACLASTDELMTMKRISDKADALTFLEEQYPGTDILLLEGLRKENIPLIEVFDSRKQKTLKFSPEILCAIVADKPVNESVPNFLFNDIDEIAGFMEEFNGK